MEYYIYIYHDEQGVPYYVGKGKGWRRNQTHDVPTPSRDSIQVLPMLTEDCALDTEEELIAFFGRKQDGGTLANKVLGGRGCKGCDWNSGEDNPYFGKEGPEHPTSKRYIVTCPDGTEVLVHGLSAWCRENNVYRVGFIKMLNGSRTTPVNGYLVRHYTV